MVALMMLGADKFRKMIKDLIEKIFAWINKNKKLVENFTEKIKKTLGLVDDKIDDLTEKELDWMASRKIGSLGGKVLSASQIRQLRGLLKQKGIDLIIESDLKSVKKLFKPIVIDGFHFDDVDDLYYFMRNNDIVGGFNAGNKQMILPANTTEIVAFHELAHVKHFEKVGEEAYKLLHSLDKEMYVWEQILARRSQWTQAELENSLWYINMERRKAGITEPIQIE